MDSAKPIYKYLTKQNSQVVDLITYGQAIHKINNDIKVIINQHITGEWRLGKFSDDELTLILSSAESAGRLRFKVGNVLQDLRTLESCKLLNKINIKVKPEITAESESEAKANKLNKDTELKPSRSGQQLLKSLADNIDDPGLKASLQRLANRIYLED